MGIAILILIYILKPNYQQKVISSTFVWKLSLKYKRKRIPINRFRNLLIFLCQVLIITSCAFILAQPFWNTNANEEHPEEIYVIDASANMLSVHDGETRFERAVKEVRAAAQDALSRNGTVTVIVAGKEAEAVVQQNSESSAVMSQLDALLEEGAARCYRGNGDIAKAMELTENLLIANPYANVYLYTGTTYHDVGGVIVESVSEEENGEWNAAILSLKSENDENYYSFVFEIGCYGTPRTGAANLVCDVYGPNESPASECISLIQPVYFEADKEMTVTFDSENVETPIFSYDHVNARLVDVDDSFTYDNAFYLYDGAKPQLKIQYASSLANNFFGMFQIVLRNELDNRYDIITKESKDGHPELEGYDFYIFEHQMPQELPADGVVLLVDPTAETLPSGLGVRLGGIEQGYFPLGGSDVKHPITANIDPSKIEVSYYTRILSAPNFVELMTCAGDPVLLITDEEKTDAKIVIFSVNVNYSDMAIKPEFPRLLLNIFNYYMPSLFTDYVFDVGDEVELTARGSYLDVRMPESPEGVHTEEFPYALPLEENGVYSFTQKLMSGMESAESLYVKIPAKQSNIFREEDELGGPPKRDEEELKGLDLYIIFASVLVALLFAEWYLQTRENY